MSPTLGWSSIRQITIEIGNHSKNNDCSLQYGWDYCKKWPCGLRDCNAFRFCYWYSAESLHWSANNSTQGCLSTRYYKCLLKWSGTVHGLGICLLAIASYAA